MNKKIEEMWKDCPWYLKILAGLGMAGGVYYFWYLKGTIVGFVLGASFIGVLLVSFGLISRGTYEAWVLAKEKADQMAKERAVATP